MSMTELERHLLNCLEELQQEFLSSQKSQNNRLASLEERQEEQEKHLNQLARSLESLEPLLHRLSNILKTA